MLGPSGFFLPADQANNANESNDLELIHTSKDGFNELYRVCKNGRFFVYKALKEDFRGNLLYEELLTKDFDIGFSLTHPGLCQYFGKISHPTIGNCIVMEWIDGCTLEEFITTKGISRQLAQKIICEICDALDYMHRKQVIHRDLKPENILITHNGQNVKIIDFGLSDMDSYSTFKAPAGTKIYAAPELIAGETVDGRCDIWSLGVIISEMHPSYKGISRKCLNRERNRRYPDAVSVGKAILKEKSRKIWTYILWCTTILAIAFGILCFINAGESAPTPEQPETVATPLTETKESVNQAVTDNVQKTKPAAESIAPPPAENLDADALEALFNDAAQSIL